MNATENIYIHDSVDVVFDKYVCLPFCDSESDHAVRYICHDIHAAVVAERSELRSELDRLHARLDAAMEWQSVLDADLPHVLIGVAVALKDGSWCEADHDHGTFRTAVGQRDITQEVIKVMRIKPPAGGEKDS